MRITEKEGDFIKGKHTLVYLAVTDIAQSNKR